MLSVAKRRLALAAFALAGVPTVLAACGGVGPSGGPAPVSQPAPGAPLGSGQSVQGVGAQGVLPAATVPAVAVEPTAVPAPMPLPRPTAQPTPVPRPPHPLSIAAMRGGEYPGSDLEIEQTLPPGSNYDRYVVSYRSEGLKIYALLTIPRGPKPRTGWPVVVFNHGFIAPQTYRTTERYIAYTDAFSRNGYIVLKSDYRGHGSSEGRPGGSYSAPDYVVDVMNALASVRRHSDADPNRVGMWGHSMGGYITLRALVLDNSIKAGVIWAGVVGSYPDILYNWNNRPPTGGLGVPPASATPGRALAWRDQMIFDYGTPDQNPGFWASISANTYLDDLAAPVQLHHGTADHSVPLPMSVTLDRQIKAAGGYSELFVYQGDDHNIAANLGTALNRSVAFFDKYVKNG